MDMTTKLLFAQAARMAAEALERWAREGGDVGAEIEGNDEDEDERREVEAVRDLAKRRGLL